MRVLVVEDQATIAFVLVDALKKAGHEVFGPAKSSDEAMQLAETNRLDIALIDLDLERRAVGLDLTQQFTAELDLDVIICTGQPELARRAPSGAIGLIRKPYDPKDVVTSLSIVEALNYGTRSPPPFPPSFELLVSPQ
jgi:DNA-binding response OmpR family regulator